jgi:hypothetical protein
VAINTYATTELMLETVFLCGLRGDVISRGQSQLLGSSAREAVKIEPEHVKLKDLHC